MIHPAVRPITSLKALAVLAAFIFSVIYVVFSYHQTLADIKSKHQALFLQEYQNIDKALQQFLQFFNLTEIRLLNAIDNKQAISPILSLRIEHLMGGAFPEIISLTFSPAATPCIVYSRFGKVQLDPKLKSVGRENGIMHQGYGKFTITTRLFDQSQKPFGSLQAKFSIAHLLYKEFAEGEIGIYPEKTFIGSRPSFKVLGLPYVFALNREPPSFRQYLQAFKLQILSALTFGLVLLFIGITAGLFFNRKAFINRRALTHKLKAAREEQEHLGGRLRASQNLLKLKHRAGIETMLLFTTLQSRYRQMAGQAQAINLLTSKLILQEAKNDRVLKEIHGISQESNAVLRKIVNGYLMKDIDESIDLMQALEHTKALFLPEIIERNTTVVIKGKGKTRLYTDRLILEIVLYNIFHLVIDRLAKNNLFQVELKGKDPVCLTFYNDGYDLGDKLSNVNSNLRPENILGLEKKKLEKFINDAGWEVSFQKAGNLTNAIRLSIPKTLNERALADNVVNIFDFKSPVS